MKLTAIILISACLTASAAGKAQKITLSEKDVPIEKVFKSIEKQSGFVFFFDYALLSQAKKVTIHVRDATLNEALALCFKGQPLNYAIVDRTIVVKPAPLPDNQSPVAAIPIPIASVTGRVVDENGQALAGVSVSFKGSTAGTTTDEAGNFSITPPAGKDVLLFSFVGYEDTEIRLSGLTHVEVQLKLKPKAMDEIVVIGYGDQRKINITGAVSQTGPETFRNRPIVNMGQGLQGVIPNLNISFADGQPNRGATFNVRGYTSINGGGALILIDGVPGEIDLINPEDIKQVTVLKDAASAAIYGGRASFGVILVTTNRGSERKPQIRYTNNFGSGRPTRIPKAVRDPLLAAQIQNEAYKGFAGSGEPNLERTIDYLTQRRADPSLPELGTDASGNWIQGADVDWYGEFYNDSQKFSKHFLSVSGGSGKVNYYLSGGLLNQDGAFRVAPDTYKKYNFASRIDVKLTGWLKIFNNVDYVKGVYDSPNKMVTSDVNVFRYISLGANSYNAIYTPSGNYTLYGARSFGVFAQGGRANTEETLFKNTVGFEIDLFHNAIKLRGDYTMLVNQDRGDMKELPISYEVSKGVMSNFHNDDYQTSQTRINHQIVNLYGSYEKNIGKHRISALGGFNSEEYIYNSFAALRQNNLSSTLGSLTLTNGNSVISDDKSEWALTGLFYRLNYAFDQKYLVEFNGRYDGTSRFPANNRFGFFPSVSAGWIVSREPFFDGIKSVVNTLKLRASYGSLGNQQVSNYAYITTMNVAQISQILNGVMPLATSAPALRSSDLTWETARTFDAGADMSLFNNRLEIGFDWYNRQTLDMLTKGKTLPAVLGASEPKVNAADLSTKGWELSVKWSDTKTVFGKPLNYSVSGVLADSRTFITRYDNPSQYLDDYYAGYEIGTIWGYQTLGFFQTDDEYQGHADQSKVQSIIYNLNGHPLAGDIKFADLNKDGIISNGQYTLGDHGDLMPIGNTTPRYTYGINLAVNWNNIDISAFFQGVGKRDFWPDNEAGVFWGFYNRYTQPVWEHINNNYWTPENPNAYFPRLRSYVALNDTRELGVEQTRYLQNAAYLRFKNLTIGYSLPAKLMKKAGISGLRIFLSGQNIGEWTKLSKAFDPETIKDEPDTGATNGNGFIYPIQRTYTFGVELNF